MGRLRFRGPFGQKCRRWIRPPRGRDVWGRGRQRGPAGWWRQRGVVDTVFEADPSKLSLLALPDDANLLVAVRLYEPKLFSFQGKSWIGPEYMTTGVIFPEALRLGRRNLGRRDCRCVAAVGRASLPGMRARCDVPGRERVVCQDANASLSGVIRAELTRPRGRGGRARPSQPGGYSESDASGLLACVLHRKLAVSFEDGENLDDPGLDPVDDEASERLFRPDDFQG
jgi:hypothetical protein